MTYLQSILFGLLQGITEPFPVSSLGHSVLLPSILGWHVDQRDPFFLIFLVATHAATAIVFLLMFGRDWILILKGMGRSLKERTIDPANHYGKLGWLLVVGTIPAGILGLLFEDQLKSLFATPMFVAAILVVNGLMLLAADAWRKRKAVETREGLESDQRVARLGWGASVKVGLMQCLALIPGFSRTGSTIAGGLGVGLSYEDAARFSFLLATPIIGAAAALKLPELAAEQSANFPLGIVIAGAIAAGFFAYLSVKFLLRYFETKKLWPFGLYCIAVGALVLIFR